MLCTDTSRFGQQSGETGPSLLPHELTLYQSFPNPATGHLTIRYAVPRTTRISLKVYDITGKQVTMLVQSSQTKPGFYNQVWNCTDTRNRKVGNGVYFYRLVSSEQAGRSTNRTEVRTRKLVIAR